MVARLLVRGMLAGLVAGMLAFCIGKVYGEPQVDWAIAYEQRTSAAEAAAPPAHTHDAGAASHAHEAARAHSHDDGAAPVSRETQAGLGLLTGTVVFGAAVGGIFALVFAAAYGRFSGLGPRATAALIAAAAFVALALVPQLKYPANPPAVGLEDTIGLRTGLFFLMLALSVAITTLSLVIAERLRPRLGGWNAALGGGATFLVLVALAFALLPTIDEVPADFSGSVLWNFRIVSLGMHAAVWATLGLLLGYLADRELRLAR